MSLAPIFASRGIVAAYHYAPMHYLLFIARAGALLSKDELARAGFDRTHFRSVSHRSDARRGFSEYVHLTLKEFPPIVGTKLAAGFPHFEVRVPVDGFVSRPVHLCRYNIAKCRHLKRNGNVGIPEAASNGRYYGIKQLPIAVTPDDCAALLDAHYPAGMIEVLIPGGLALPPETSFVFFRQEDLELARAMLAGAALNWDCRLADVRRYRAEDAYATLVRNYLDESLANPSWRGDGLEFDAV